MPKRGLRNLISCFRIDFLAPGFQNVIHRAEAIPTQGPLRDAMYTIDDNHVNLQEACRAVSFSMRSGVWCNQSADLNWRSPRKPDWFECHRWPWLRRCADRVGSFGHGLARF